MFCFGFKEELSAPEKTVKEKIITALTLEIIAGEASPLYKNLVINGLINDEFSTEHFCGNGYSALIFEGESSDPKAVCEAIKKEVERLKIDGVDKKLFAAVRSGMYGGAIRVFDNVESIAMQLTDCAMNDSGLFDDIKYLKSVTLDDIERKIATLNQENTVLSVINPK